MNANYLQRFKRFLFALAFSVTFIGFPLFWLRFCHWTQDAVSLNILSDQPISVFVGTVSEQEGSVGSLLKMSRTFNGTASDWNQAGIYSFRLDGADERISPSHLCFRIDPDEKVPDLILIRGIHFAKYGCLQTQMATGSIMSNYTVDAASMEPTGNGLRLSPDGNNPILLRPGAKFHCDWNTHFGHFRTRMKLSLVVIAVVAMALPLLVAIRNPSRSLSRKDVAQIILVSGAAAFFFAIVLPVSSFLANQDAFSYTLQDLLPSAAVSFAILFATLLLVLFASVPCFSLLLVLMVQGFLVYEYCETGILAADFPELTGSADFFQKIPRQLADAAFLFVVMFGFPLLEKWIRPYLHWISLGFLVMVSASMFDVKVADRAAQEAKGSNRFIHPADDVVESCVFSKQRNVLFFVLDAIDVKVSSDALEQNPQWEESLPGFIVCTNNVGMYPLTSYGVAGILTGRYAPSDIYGSDYPMEAIGSNAFYRAYAESGFPVFAVQAGLGLGWSNAISNAVEEARQTAPGTTAQPPSSRRMSAQMAWNLREIVWFRAIPFLEKGEFLGNRTAFWSSGLKSSYRAENTLFDKLRTVPVLPDAPCVLQFHHTIGGHIPFIRDRNGNLKTGRTDDMDGYLEQSCYAIGETVRFLSDLDARGLYDNSLIVILADHGLTFQHFQDVERSTHPMLWVKPPHSRAPLSRTAIPTSHSRIHALALASLHADPPPSTVMALLRHDDDRTAYTFARGVQMDKHIYGKGDNSLPDEGTKR